jgi:RNA polymerase sigma-70 factor (ECF subfamily)
MGEEAESTIRGLWEAQSYDRAATRALEVYGIEIRRFIAGRTREEADARDIFSMFCEDLWRGLPGFSWRCALRGWAYTIARHAELRYATSPSRWRERGITLSGMNVVVGARTSTAPYERTDVKDRFREIRLRLSDEDQMILVLRVDRGLTWLEIAQVLACPDSPSQTDLCRREARIRKRFQSIKEQLRRWAAADGLLPEPSLR